MKRIALALALLAAATPAFAQQTRQEWIDLQIVREAAAIADASRAKIELEQACKLDPAKPLTDAEKAEHASLCKVGK
jgi:hypothetical protein